jgi:hypothetical protein
MVSLLDNNSEADKIRAIHLIGVRSWNTNLNSNPPHMESWGYMEELCFLGLSTRHRSTCCPSVGHLFKPLHAEQDVQCEMDGV